jgi:hydrogenase maturation protease
MADILGNLDGVELLILVDAARSDAAHPPGAWQRIDYVRDRPRLGSRPNTNVHSLSVELALNLSHEMGRLPPEVWVYAIAAEDYGHGEEVAPQVRRAIREVAQRIMAETSKRRKVEKSKHGATAATRTEPGRTSHRLETGATSAPIAEGKQHA